MAGAVACLSSEIFHAAHFPYVESMLRDGKLHVVVLDVERHGLLGPSFAAGVRFGWEEVDVL